MRKSQQNQKLMIGLGIAFVLVLVLCSWMYYSKGKGDEPTAKKQAPIPPEEITTPVDVEQDDQTKPTVILFWAKWCPHCKHMLGDWKQLEDALKSSNVMVANMEEEQNGGKVTGLKGYPSVRFYPEGIHSPSFEEYHGDRSFESLLEFVQKQL